MTSKPNMPVARPDSFLGYDPVPGTKSLLLVDDRPSTPRM